jgi:zinc/manganese transport system substrate-binding protein
MAELDSAQADAYASGLQAFSERWEAAIARWEAQAAPLKGTAVVPHHKDMVYLLAWLGMHEVGNLEPKPGLEPSSAHLAELLAQLEREPAKLVLRTPYQSERASQWLAERAGIRAVTLPSTVGGSEAATDLFTLFDDIVARLLEGIR